MSYYSETTKSKLPVTTTSSTIETQIQGILPSKGNNNSYNNDQAINNNISYATSQNKNDNANDYVVNSAVSNNINSNNNNNNNNSNSYDMEEAYIYDETEVAETYESVDTSYNSNESVLIDNHTQIIMVVFTIIILFIFSLTLIKLKNRSNDNKPIQEKSIYDQNKPLPLISPSLLKKHNQTYQQIPSLQIQNSTVINMDYNNSYMIPNQNQNIKEYDIQQQQQQQQYDYNDRISFLALGDSAIEPRQKSLALKEDIIKQSKDNIPIPLIHLNKTEGTKGRDEVNKDDEDDINLKAVEPLPGTVIPSKKSSQKFSNNRLLQESHDFLKKMSKGVKNHLKQNSIISTSSKSNTSTSFNSDANNINNSNNHRILSSLKE